MTTRGDDPYAIEATIGGRRHPEAGDTSGCFLVAECS
jgi:hypothetical protein